LGDAKKAIKGERGEKKNDEQVLVAGRGVYQKGLVVPRDAPKEGGALKL